MVDSADESLHVETQCRGIAPAATSHDPRFAVEDHLAVRRLTHNVMEAIVHRVGEPAHARTEEAFRLRNVHQAFVQIERTDVVVELRMRQWFVDVEELYAFVFVV
jgi:hypothetical protein